MKKVVFFTHGKVNPYEESGMSRVVYYRAKYLKQFGVDVEILSVWDRIKKPTDFVRDEFVTVKLFPRIFPSSEITGHPLLQYIKENASNIGIVDFHLMWFYDKIPVARLLKKLNIPYVVSTHGAYTQDRLKLKKFKKVPSFLIYERPFLNSANGLIAQTPEELTELRNLGVSSPIYLSSIGIDPNEIELGPSFLSFNPNKIKLAWVGNITPVKNLHNLIRAVGIMENDKRSKLELYLVGPQNRDKKYFTFLKELVSYYKLEGIVTFLGPLYKKEKFSLLKEMDGYIHVSTSETISLAALEAMAVGKPLIISRTSEVAYLYKYSFFIMVEPWYDHIKWGIEKFMNLKEEERKAMGETARKVAHELFNWEKVVKEYLNILKNVGNFE
jgi:glycosyltransferase involved in cell wall biosynthesis